jgi:hypothetical protein
MRPYFNSGDTGIQARPCPAASIVPVTPTGAFPIGPVIAVGASCPHSATTRRLVTRLAASLTVMLAAVGVCAALSAAPAAAQPPGGCIVPLGAGSPAPSVPCPRTWSPQPVQPIDGTAGLGDRHCPSRCHFRPLSWSHRDQRKGLASARGRAMGRTMRSNP